MITKNSVVKIQNLVVNHESRLVKSKPGDILNFESSEPQVYDRNFS